MPSFEVADPLMVLIGGIASERVCNYARFLGNWAYVDSASGQILPSFEVVNPLSDGRPAWPLQGFVITLTV